MARDGYSTLGVILITTVIITVIAFTTQSMGASVFSGAGWLFLLFSLYFFRDPDRIVPQEKGAVLSPGDGKVVEIREVREEHFLKGPATQISIFLSVFDVHVNRIPISGTVAHFDYARGKFMQAFRPEASQINEQTIIGIEADGGRLVFKQIAGILARRIICHVREGFSVKAGDRFGLIRFGSRVDVLLPPGTEIRVQLNQRVKGGESILAKFTDE